DRGTDRFSLAEHGESAEGFIMRKPIRSVSSACSARTLPLFDSEFKIQDSRLLFPLAALMLGLGCAAGTQAAPAGQAIYEAWVASESLDQVAQIRFDGREASVIARRPVGVIPVELEGPHGIAVSP